MKDGIITKYGFEECHNFNHVDLLEGELHETIAALHFEDWKRDMNQEINSINRILPDAPAQGFDDNGSLNGGEKGIVYQRGLDRFFAKLVTTKQSINACWTRL